MLPCLVSGSLALPRKDSSPLNASPDSCHGSHSVLIPSFARCWLVIPFLYSRQMILQGLGSRVQVKALCRLLGVSTNTSINRTGSNKEDLQVFSGATV